MDDVKEVDADTRQGLRILADSTKLKGTEGVARRLNKAAESGSQSDYDQAEKQEPVKPALDAKDELDALKEEMEQALKV